MKFSKTNLCAESSTVITASSAHPNFPASNLKSIFRSKRWRSRGNFVIDSTNNKINFKESALGSELTATLTSGSYTTSTLATEIKTQLESVGAETYTVSYSSSTGLWTISSTGTYLDLLNTTGTNQANSTLKNSLGFGNSDRTGSLSYTGSLIAIHTIESLVFDLQTAQDISCIALFWPKEDGIRLSQTAVVKIEANAVNSWTSPALSQTLTIDDNYMVASHFFATPQEYRYWRITIQDSQNPNLFVELGLAWIGEDVGFNEPENGFKFRLVDPTVESKTDFGHSYSDEYPLINQLEFNYKYIDYETMQGLEDVFRQNGNRKPVLVCFDDQESSFNRNHFLIYGKLGRNFDTDHVVHTLFQGGLKITELG